MKQFRNVDHYVSRKTKSELSNPLKNWDIPFRFFDIIFFAVLTWLFFHAFLFGTLVGGQDSPYFTHLFAVNLA
ncbi:MAG: hypothetical protein IJA85_08220 [Clostridia bacterium]|nr:hypothetical protein [Clostridia bacterium]